MSSLLLLRHGQASFGDDDYDRLSALGERQAQATGAYLARHGNRFNEILVGPRRRQYATAAAALSHLPQAPAPTIVPSLDEFAEASQILQAAQRLHGLTPQQVAGLPRREQLRHYESFIEAWMRGRAALDGRPDALSFRATVAQWLRERTSRPLRGEQVLAVTSAGVIAAAVAEVLDVPVERMAQFTSVLRNASLTELVFSPGRVSLVSFNSVAHLPVGLDSGM